MVVILSGAVGWEHHRGEVLRDLSRGGEWTRFRSVDKDLMVGRAACPVAPFHVERNAQVLGTLVVGRRRVLLCKV
jgi:hypothetical protein